MKRRTFSKAVFSAVPLIGIPVKEFVLPKKRRILPKKLKKGDTIGFISPGSFLSDEGLEKAIKNVEELGFKIELSKNIRAKRGFNAGTDAERLADLHAMFANKNIDGIWCIRGGYGCTRLLENIDYQLIKKNPKTLIGYSDITALLNAINCKTGLVGFHGPVAASDFTDYTVRHFEEIVMNQKAGFEINLCEENVQNEDAVFQSKVIRKGSATGELVGGNLSLLASIAGTDFQPNFKNKIVFIEDVGEKPYRIDRMLTQLRQATNLREAGGIALGIFSGCETDNLETSLSLMATLEDRFADFNIPIAYGLNIGHISNQCTLPVGIEAEFDAEKLSLKILM